MSEVFEKQSISSELAHRVIAAAEAKATEMGVPMGIAICDEAGVLKAFSRMDGAALFAVQIAQDKAYTAVGFGMPSGGWHDFIKARSSVRSASVVATTARTWRSPSPAWLPSAAGDAHP